MGFDADVILVSEDDELQDQSEPSNNLFWIFFLDMDKQIHNKLSVTWDDRANKVPQAI